MLAIAARDHIALMLGLDGSPSLSGERRQCRRRIQQPARSMRASERFWSGRLTITKLSAPKRKFSVLDGESGPVTLWTVPAFCTTQAASVLPSTEFVACM